MRSTRIALLVAINAFVGAMVGLERTVLPVLAQERFGIASAAAATSFIVAFGVTKAFTNLFAGKLADRFGRRRVLLAGWLVGVPVPIILLLAPSWSFVIAANVLLGVNQGLAWSMTVNMKLDLARPERRGLVVGLNEMAGYTGLAVVAFVTGFLAQPFWLGIAIAVAGLLLSFFARETAPTRVPGAVGRVPMGDTETEQMPAAATSSGPGPSPGPGTRDPSPASPHPSPGTRRPLVIASIGGLATNLKDGALWGLLPILLIASGASLATLALIVATYPLLWGLSQGAFGWWSDTIGRKPLIIGGLVVQAGGVAWLAYAPGLMPAAVVGVGTAMAYPTLLASVSDASQPETRATALGIYRFWRDMGYAFGALGAGILADLLGVREALYAVAAVVAVAAILNGR